ncbi:MAG: serine hydrolase [Planctomycetes bacterium]|nr:serine hydrolase [Planctomycetota bacterium]
MRLATRFVVAFAFLGLSLPAQAPAPTPTPYLPPRGPWERRPPEQHGLDPAAVAAAVQIGIDNEHKGPRDMRQFLAQSFGNEPHSEPIGPVFDRGGSCGLIVKGGYVVAEWGDVARADMCNSVTKTFLTTVVGLAWQRGLIRDVHDRAAAYMPAGVELFTSAHNRAITWDHLLRQTSDWQGELWGKPDWADRPEGKTPADWPQRPLREPGMHYKYNDVRVNVLALATLHVWRRPLPVVLREEVMDPIGASATWRWHGYDNAWVELDGARVQSVSGGGHWGGGMCIGTEDLARFGLLFVRDGRWGERQIVPTGWLAMARTPGAANAGYGHANWFLNTDRKSMPAAPASAVRFLGNGGNIVYVDRDHDLVVVTRWLRDAVWNELLGKLLAGLAPAAGK